MLLTHYQVTFVVIAPGTFTGPLGDFIMSDIWTKPIRNFKKIGKDFPRLDRKVLYSKFTEMILLIAGITQL